VGSYERFGTPKIQHGARKRGLGATRPPCMPERYGGGDPAARLLVLRADPLDTFDRESGPATFLGDP